MIVPLNSHSTTPTTVMTSSNQIVITNNNQYNSCIQAVWADTKSLCLVNNRCTQLYSREPGVDLIMSVIYTLTLLIYINCVCVILEVVCQTRLLPGKCRRIWPS